MKVNEAIYRSPKWLRNIMDFEVSTGEDIKGSPSKKRAKIIEEERKKKAEEDRLKAEKERKKREEEDEKLLNTYFNTVMAYIEKRYRDCYITILEDNIIIIENDDLIYDNRQTFSFTVKMDNNYTIPRFEVYIKVGNKSFDYRVSGFNYTNFKLFIINHVAPFCNSGKAKKRPTNYTGYNSGKGYRSGQQKEKASTRTNKGTMDDPTENRKRRSNLLKDMLEGYERQLDRLINENPYDPEIETLKNEIVNIKDKIKKMEGMKENLKYVKTFQLFEKSYDPMEGDQVMITYWLTGEPVPVRIKKRYRNNTYLVSFDVEGSTAKGAPDANIRNSDIISPYKGIKTSVGPGYISANTNMSLRQVHQVSNDMYL